MPSVPCKPFSPITSLQSWWIICADHADLQVPYRPLWQPLVIKRALIMKSSSLESKSAGLAHSIPPAVPTYWNYRTGHATQWKSLGFGFFYSRIHEMADDVTITMREFTTGWYCSAPVVKSPHFIRIRPFYKYWRLFLSSGWIYIYTGTTL